MIFVNMKKIMLILFVISLVGSSCRTSGYGCQGRQSWEQMTNRNNRLF